MKTFTARIRKYHGQPAVEILAKTKESNDSFFVCYRETLDGVRKCRNLYFSCYSGYYTLGKPEHNMYEYMLKKSPTIINCDRTITEREAKIFTELEPNFKYIIQKTSVQVLDAFRTFKFWKQHPEMELLLNMGFTSLATNGNFFKLSKEEQKDIISYYLKNEKKDDTRISDRSTAMLIDIQGAMKMNTTPSMYNWFRRIAKPLGIDLKTACKLSNKGINFNDYHYYTERLKTHFPERLTDEYWTTFKDVHDFHEKENRVNTQIDNMRSIEDRKRAAKLKRQYKNAVKKVQWQCQYNDLTIYIPQSIDDIVNQAKSLNQCLIRNDYPDEVIKKKCYLIFIKKGDEPLATAELLRKENKIGQFYGNELDRNNCLPSDECRKALDYFMNKFVKNAA